MGAEEAQAEDRVFSIADIPGLGNTVSRRKVYIPAWRAHVWVWGTAQAEDMYIADQMQVALAGTGDQASLEAEARRRVATIMQCVKDSGEDDAKPVFTGDQWGWIEQQPTAAKDTILSVVRELDASGEETQEKLADFFGLATMLRDCLQRIASHCGACTDCPKSSPRDCPLQRLTSLLPPTASSPNGSTDGSATTAPSLSDNDNGA